MYYESFSKVYIPGITNPEITHNSTFVNRRVNTNGDMQRLSHYKVWERWT